MYAYWMGLKARPPRQPRNLVKCWRCREEVTEIEDLPDGWEAQLAIHLKRPKYRHICPRCIID